MRDTGVSRSCLNEDRETYLPCPSHGDPNSPQRSDCALPFENCHARANAFECDPEALFDGLSHDQAAVDGEHLTRYVRGVV